MTSAVAHPDGAFLCRRGTITRKLNVAPSIFIPKRQEGRGGVACQRKQGSGGGPFGLLLSFVKKLDHSEPTSPRTFLPTVGGHAAWQRKTAAASGKRRASLTGNDKTTLPALMHRASNTARQMRYFGLVAKRSSFRELVRFCEARRLHPAGPDYRCQSNKL